MTTIKTWEQPIIMELDFTKTESELDFSGDKAPNYTCLSHIHYLLSSGNFTIDEYYAILRVYERQGYVSEWDLDHLS